MKLQFKTTPWKHQLAAVKYLMPLSYGALYTDMGTGKTKIIIDLIANKGYKRVLIVAPKKVCSVWGREFDKHAPEILQSPLNLSDIAGDKKVQAVNNLLNLPSKGGTLTLVCNYDSIWREPFKTFLLKKFKAEAVICDESHRIKSPSSKCSRFLTQLGKLTPNRFLMTGTPLAQSPLDIYAQYRFLNPLIFGTNFGNFKQEYANWIQVPAGFPMLDKKNPYKNLDKLQEKMFSCAFKTDSDIELPPTQDILPDFNLSTDAEKHYKELQKQGCMELGGGVVDGTCVLTLVTRLQQLTSGYLPIENEEGVKSFVEVDTGRQDTLSSMFEDLPPREPIVVFAKYRKDISNILEIVKQSGRKSSELSGKADTLKEWMAGKTDVLVVQISSGAEGIDLTRSHYCVYYTMTHSLSQYLQSRKRVHRPGQDNPVIYYTLVARMKKGVTIDEKILEALWSNQEVINTIMYDREV